MKLLQFEKSIVFRFLYLFSHQNRKKCTKYFTKIFDFCIVNLSFDFVVQRNLITKSFSFKLKKIYIQKK